MSWEQLRNIGWRYTEADIRPDWQNLIAAHSNARPARVVEQHRSGYIVAECPGFGFKAISPPEWQLASHKQAKLPAEQRPAVGDWVLIEDGALDGNARIVALLPRHTAIKRAAAGEHYQQQVIAANIDTAFVVCGLDADFNPRRIERYLLLMSSGINPVVVLTKADLVERRRLDGLDTPEVDEALAKLSELSAQGVPIQVVNAKDSASISSLQHWLGPGRTAVLIGSSGAGKSTLTNTLLGNENQRTAEVRKHDSRGRHTTTYRTLIALPSGGCLIDTPGMRELKPTGEEDMTEGRFADIETLATRCKFRDCQHAHEPGCAVRAAIASGVLEAKRFGNYVKLRNEIAHAADKLAIRLAQRAEAKPKGKILRKQPDAKHGKS